MLQKTIFIICTIFLLSCNKNQQIEVSSYFNSPISDLRSKTPQSSFAEFQKLLQKADNFRSLDSIDKSVSTLDIALNILPPPKSKWIEYIELSQLKATYLQDYKPEESYRINSSLLSYYNEALSDSIRVRIYQQLAQIDWYNYRFQKAHKKLDTAFQIAGYNSNLIGFIHQERGNVYYCEHNLASAIMHYKTSIKHLPKDDLYNAYQNLCLFMVNDSLYEESKNYLNFLYQNSSNSRDLYHYFKLSAINEKLGSKYQEAVILLTSADSLAKTSSEISKLEHSDGLSELGNCLTLLGKGEEAITIFNEALQLAGNPERTEYHSALLYKLKAFRTLAESSKNQTWVIKGLDLAEEIFTLLDLMSKTHSEADLLDILTYFHDMYDDWLYLASQFNKAYSTINKDILLFKIFKRRKDHLSKNFSRNLSSDFKNIRSKANKYNATYVSYFLGHTNTFVFTINKSGAFFKKLNHPDSLKSIIKTLDYNINNSNANKKLYNELIKPIEGQLSGTIVFIPDNEISNVAFKFLIDHDGNQLMDNYDLAYSSSLSRCLNARLDAKIDLTKSNICAFAYSDHSTIFSDNHSELPSSIREIDYFNKFPDSKRFYGNKSTKENLFEHGQNVSILHLAIHGYSHATDHQKNYLVFRKSDATPDTLWTNEVTEFNSELLVLSSCLSSSGAEYPVDGVYNLVKTFQKSGANFIVSSLSTTEDRIMPIIMSEFYNQIKTDKSIIESFNLAQKKQSNKYYNTLRINI